MVELLVRLKSWLIGGSSGRAATPEPVTEPHRCRTRVIDFYVHECEQCGHITLTTARGLPETRALVARVAADLADGQIDVRTEVA